MSVELVVLPPLLQWIVAAGLGAIIGSFLNVVIHRLPKMEGYWPIRVPLVPLSVTNAHPICVGDHTVALPLPNAVTYGLSWPPSHCPYCKHGIAWYDNMPILSWLLLRGRCRNCRRFIAIRYPLIELSSAALATGLFAIWGWSPGFWGLFALAAALIVILFIDVDYMIIPDSITLPMLWTGLIFKTVFWRQGGDAILGAAGGYLTFLLIETLSRVLLGKEGMGRGDAKLAALLGAWLGPVLLSVAVLVGFFFGSVSGLVIELWRRRWDLAATWQAVKTHRTQPFPFGPSLVLGGFASLFAGSHLVGCYLRLLRG